MDGTRSFAPLLIVVLLAFAVPLLLSRFRRLSPPIVVGEIVAGILVGRSFLGWVAYSDPVLKLLSEFGIVFLMFLSGMEIDFQALRGIRGPAEDAQRRRVGTLTLGVLTFALTLFLSTGVAFGLLQAGLTRNPWFMALILSTTSLGVVLPVLKEKGLTPKPLGQAILFATVFADFATMFLITVAVAAMSHGLTAHILLVVVLFVVFFLLLRFGRILNNITALRRTVEELSHATAQIKVRAAFSMMLGFVALSEALGAEIILGAFLAGAVVALLRTPADDDLAHQLEAIGFGFFIPIFFINVGIELNLPALFNSPGTLLLVPVLLGAAILVKFIPALTFLLSFNMRETMAAAALLTARLSLIIAAAAIGKRLGVIDDAMGAAIVLMAIVTVTIAPLIFVRLAPGRAAARARTIVIAGAGELGLRVAKQLLAHHEPVVIIDFEGDPIARARERGFEAVQANLNQNGGDASSLLQSARALVSTFDDVELSYRVCELAKRRHEIEQVVAHVADPRELPRFEELGVTATNSVIDRAALLVLLVRSPTLYTLLSRGDEDKGICEVVVRNPDHVGKRLRQLQLPGDILALAVRRGEDVLVPHGDTRLNLNDRLTLAGSVNDLSQAEEMFAMTSDG